MSRTTQLLVVVISGFVLVVTPLKAQDSGPGSRLEAEKTGESPVAKGSAAKDGTQKSPAGSEAAAGAAELPAGVLAVVNGREITIDEYVGYLLASIGKSRLDEYINRLLLDEEARGIGVSVTPEEVEAAVEERVRRIIKSLYLGKREGYLADLEKRRSNLESEKSRLRQELYYDLLQDRVIIATRKITDEVIRRQFEKVYGEGGVQYVLRHILISTRGRKPDTTEKKGRSTGSIIRRSPGEAKERAEQILTEVRGGLDFSQAVKQYSDDSFTRANQGRIPNYRKGPFGESFDAAVLQLTKESPVSGVVESPRGYHIIQLIEKRTTQFEDVKAEVEEAVKSLPPSTEERQMLLLGLRKKANIQGL